MSRTPSHRAPPLAIVCTMSCKAALIELVPRFERTTAWAVDVTYGAGAGLARRIREGLHGDIFVGPEEFSATLVAEGWLDGSVPSAFAHSGAVIAVRTGSPHPRIDTAGQLAALLWASRGIAYSTGASGIHFLQACERIGMRHIVEARRVVPRPGEMVGPVLVRGEADIGVQQPAELLLEPGVEIVGPLPEGLRETIVYGATRFSGSGRDDAVRVFLEFMRSPASREVLRHTGLDPV